MTGLEVVAILLAGLAAGTINTVVGSGTLITFPTLLALGVPPVTANVSNTVGLVPGSLSGAIGYRRELAGQRPRLLRLGSASLLGGAIGAALLLVLPSAVFDAIVPVLIGLGCLLVMFQPRISGWVVGRAEHRGVGVPEHGALWVWTLVLLAGVYGGYFGAAQGVLLMAILGVGLQEAMQRNNATRNVLALLVNAVAAARLRRRGRCRLGGRRAHRGWRRRGRSARGDRRATPPGRRAPGRHRGRRTRRDRGLPAGLIRPRRPNRGADPRGLSRP